MISFEEHFVCVANVPLSRNMAKVPQLFGGSVALLT